MGVGKTLFLAWGGQVIFVFFFFHSAALQMPAVVLATLSLCTLWVKKINLPKFHLPCLRPNFVMRSNHLSDTPP